MKKTIIIGALIAAGMLTIRSAGACSLLEPVPSPDVVVGHAQVIALATAIDVWREPDRRAGVDGIVEFRIDHVLKGDLPARVIRIVGTLTEQDDFNDIPMPHTFVRREGRGGSCFATTYKKDGTFLLMLKPIAPERFEPFKPEWTPYWQPLAPINEQVHGADDPWVAWVRTRLAR